MKQLGWWRRLLWTRRRYERWLRDADQRAAAACREATSLREQLRAARAQAEEAIAERSRCTAAVARVERVAREMEIYAEHSGVPSWWAPRIRRALDGREDL